MQSSVFLPTYLLAIPDYSQNAQETKEQCYAPEKCLQVQDEAQRVKNVQATAAEKRELLEGDAVPSISTAGFPQKSQDMPPTKNLVKVPKAKGRKMGTLLGLYRFLRAVC